MDLRPILGGLGFPESPFQESFEAIDSFRGINRFQLGIFRVSCFSSGLRVLGLQCHGAGRLFSAETTWIDSPS